MAYGGSQARDLIRSTAAGLRQSHSNAGSEPHLRSTPQLKQHRILNPLSEARDGNCNLIVPSQIRFCCATMGTLQMSFLKSSEQACSGASTVPVLLLKKLQLREVSDLLKVANQWQVWNPG